MKKYIVQRWVKGVASNRWEFNNKIESLKFYETKAKSLSKERKEENQQAKFENTNTRGYTWLNLENSLEVLSNFKRWEYAKNEK